MHLTSDIQSIRQLKQQLSQTPWVYIALGSNLGNTRKNLVKSLALLQASPNITVRRVSPFITTPPWGDTNQPDFLNAVAELDCDRDVSPQILLKQCQQIEQQLGRTRDPRRPYGPRSIDLDILIFKGQTVDNKELHLPHPRMWERDFVLTPLRMLLNGAAIDELTSRFS